MSEARPIPTAVDPPWCATAKLTAVDPAWPASGKADSRLVGESGCGKTSLAKALVRLLPWHPGGSCSTAPTRSAAASARAGCHQRIQLLFQGSRRLLSPRLTIRRLLEEPLRVRRARRPTLARSRHFHRAWPGARPRPLSPSIEAARPGACRWCGRSPCGRGSSWPTADRGARSLGQGRMLNLLAQVQRQLPSTYLVVSRNLNIVGRITDRVAVIISGPDRRARRDPPRLRSACPPYTAAALLAANPSSDPQHRRQRIGGNELPSPQPPQAALPLARPARRGANRGAGPARGGGRPASGLPFFRVGPH